MAFDVMFINLQNLREIVNMNNREISKLGLNRLTVKPTKKRKLNAKILFFHSNSSGSQTSLLY